MVRTLSDFRVETDHVIWLSFCDGNNYRVGSRDLQKHLTGVELERVKQALTTRHEFIKDILPPTAVGVILVAFTSITAFLFGTPSQPAPQAAIAKAMGVAYQLEVVRAAVGLSVTPDASSVGNMQPRQAPVDTNTPSGLVPSVSAPTTQVTVPTPGAMPSVQPSVRSPQTNPLQQAPTAPQITPNPSILPTTNQPVKQLKDTVKQPLRDTGVPLL